MPESKSPYNPLHGDRPDLIVDLNDGSEERVSIIVVHNDRPEYLNLCLQSITIASLNSNYELIVVDNASRDTKTQAFLDQLEDDGVKVIRNDENLYWSKAANQGARAADPDSRYLIFMHHDVNVINAAWIDLMINVSESSKSGLVGVQLDTYGLPGGQRINFVSEICMLVTRQCWKDCGPFTEELPQVGSAFMFTLTANSKGYNPQVIQNPCVHHWQTLAIDFNEYEKFAEQARAKMPKMIQEAQQASVAV